jgi:hypothetical protein
MYCKNPKDVVNANVFYQTIEDIPEKDMVS